MARRAARSALSGSAPTSGAISRASRAMRSTRSPWVPSFSWKTTLVAASFAMRWSSGFFRSSWKRSAVSRSRSRSGRSRRSVSQKWRASARRARMTRSLPATIVPPPSLASILATRTKRLERFFARPSQHEALLVGADGGPDHLGRDGEERLLEGADQHHRPFDQPGDLLEQRIVLDEFEAEGECPVAGGMEDDVLPPVGVEHHHRLLELWHIVVEAPHGDLSRRHEAMALGRVAGADAVDVELDDLGVGGFRPEDAEDRMERTHPGERLASHRRVAVERRSLRCRLHAPAHRFRPGERANDARARSRRSPPAPGGRASRRARRRNHPSCRPGPSPRRSSRGRRP